QACRGPQRQIVDDARVRIAVGVDRVAVVQNTNRADIREQRGADAVFLGQAIRNGQLDGADDVEIAAQGVRGQDVARTDARRLEAAEAVAALEEAVVDADRVAAPARDVAGRGRGADHPVRGDPPVGRHLGFGLDVVHIAAEAREVLDQTTGPAAGRTDR